MPTSQATFAILEIKVAHAPMEKFRLDQETTLIGRVRGDLILDDSELSATHCQIQQLSDGYHIFDLNSTNGTFLNGRRILKSRLNPGDVIKIGNVEATFTFEIEQGAPLTKTLLESFQAPKQLESASAQEILNVIQSAKESCIAALGLILDVTYPDKSSEKIEVRERKIIIGRITPFGRFDQDEEISRRHLSLVIEASGEVMASDAGSTNGTFVNDKRVFAPVPVTQNDTIRIGGTRIRVAIHF